MGGDLRPGSSGDYDSDEDDLELRAIGRAVLRKKAWIVAATLVTLLGTLLFVFTVKPRYTADAQVLLENQENFLTRPGNSIDPAQALAPDDEAVASQIQLVTSRDLARQAIKALHLKGNPEFDPSGGGLSSRLGALLGLSRPRSALSEEDRILQNYFDRLTVFQVVKSRVLEIEFTSQDPDLAARAANTIANLYIDVQIDAKHARAKAAATSLAAQIADLQTRLSAAEEKAESFRASSGMLMGANNMTLSAQQLADLNTQLVTARTAQAEAQAKAKLIRDMLRKARLDQVSDVANNGLVRQLSEQRVTLRGQLALQLRTLLPGHPKIKELQAQIADLDGELRTAGENVARGLENDATIAGARLDSIRATLDEQKQAMGDSSVNAVRLRGLDSDAKLLRDQLGSITTGYQDAVARETSTSTPGDARVISQAMAPELPSFPRKGPMLVFATLAGLVLSSAAVIAGALLSGGAQSRTVSSPAAPVVLREDEEEEDDEEDLRVAEAERRGEPERAVAQPMGAPFMGGAETNAAESAPTLAERILAARAPGRAACVLVVGLTESASAGAEAVQLGRTLVREGRTILVELRQGLLSGSGLAAAQSRSEGLGELIDGELSFAEVIHRDDVSRLHFVVAGSAVAHSGEPLDIAVEALGETYDHVVMLAAPIGSDPLAMDLAGSADFVALVTSGRRTDARVLDARSEFSRAGAGEVVVMAAQQASEKGRVSAA